MKIQHIHQASGKIMVIIMLYLFSLQAFAGKFGCTAAFDYSIDNLTNTVSFENLSSDGNTNVHWDFGDGNFSNEMNPIHQYADSDSYLVCLDIFSDTCQDVVCHLVDLNGSNSDNCEAAFNYFTSDDDLEFQFQNTSTGILDSVYWDFGDGSFSRDTNPTHHYETEGQYMVCLSILTPNCSDTFCQELDAYLSDCSATFSYEVGASPDSYQFFNESIGNVDFLFWDFGDGESSTEENPIHQFASSGDYDVQLRIRNNDASCSDTITHTVRVQIPDPCLADFSFSIDPISQRPNIYSFQDLSTGNIASWEWNFGDGSTSSLASPTHVFPDTLSYAVTLTINGDDCSDQTSKTVKVDVPLSLDFTFQLDSNNVIPNTFIFHSEVIGFYDHLNWNFNNTIISNTTDTIHSYPGQDKDYQVCLSAQYNFNDTSSHQLTLCKGLTTSEYFDIGGQVFFGDSLLNNPVSTGDSGIAYLYRVDGNHITPIDTNYFVNLGYYWFAEKLKAYYIIRTALEENAAHYEYFAPTYVGNTTQWEQAEIINLAKNKYREDVHLVEDFNIQKGSASISGSVFDMLNINNSDSPVTICLFDVDHNLIDYQYTSEEGSYSFQDISMGHYWLIADYPGIHNRPKLVYVDGRRQLDFKDGNISNISGVFPNPAFDYCLLAFTNTEQAKTIEVQVFSAEGNLLYQENQIALPGTNYYRIDLKNLPNGLLLIKTIDNQQIHMEKVLHY